MTRIRYQVAVTLDGYIAGPNGEADWIVMDADIDFGVLFAEFDTFLIGRRTFAVAGAMGSAGSGSKTFVFSRTLRPEEHSTVTIVPEVRGDRGSDSSTGREGHLVVWRRYAVSQFPRRRPRR